MTQTLGEAIHDARLARRFTLRRLAAALGVAHTSVVNWERDVNTPLLRHVLGLETVLELEAGALQSKWSATMLRRATANQRQASGGPNTTALTATGVRSNA